MRLTFLFVIICCLSFSLFGLDAGEVLLFSEGWEQGTYNWTVVNGTETNKWQAGNATYQAGSRSMYISDDNGRSNSYDTSRSSTVHFWRSISIPASATNIRLTFQYKVNGERRNNSVYDYLTYRILPISSNVTAGRKGDNCLTGSSVGWTNTSSWATHTKDFSSSLLAGHTRKLVFSWINNGSGGSQPPVAIDNISLTYKIATNAPIHLAASITGKSVTLSWDPPSPASVGDVHGYRVFRDGRDISGLRYTLTFFDNTTDYQKTYRYHVIAVYKNPERTSGASNAVSVETPPNPPRNLTSTLSGKTINLSWDAPPSASGGTLVGYRVFRDDKVIAQQVTSRTYSDNTTEFNKTYVYNVVAIYSNPAKTSGPSNNRSVNTPSLTTQPPRNLNVTLDGKNVILKWDVPSSGSSGTLSGYRVYRDNYILSSVQSWTTYTDSTTEFNKTYQYHVIAIYADPNRESRASNSRSVKTPMLITHPPLNLTASLQDNGRIRLVWLPPQQGSTGTFRGYKVFKNGVATSDIFTLTEWTDRKTQSNKTYLYDVSAVYSNPDRELKSNQTQITTPKSYAWIYWSTVAVIVLIGWLIIKMIINAHYSYVCPYCFCKIDKRKIPYTCQDCGDKYYLNFLGRRPLTCKKPSCKKEISSLIPSCPKCNAQIVQAALDTTPYPFSIIGTTSSGKTIFTTVMLHEVSGVIDPELALDDPDRETFTNQNENTITLYGSPPRVLDPTAPGLKRPQIWPVKNFAKNHTYTFTIYDGAGEDHENNITPHTKVCQYIKASKAIIYTLDATKLLSNDDGKARHIVNSLANYIKTALGKKANDTLKIPIAVVLTKFDTVLNHPQFAPTALVKQNLHCVRNGKLNLSELRQIDHEIRNWLNDIGKVAFLRAFKMHFREYHFFGVSSLGMSPNSDGTLPGEPKPHRVLDPVLWLFKKARFID